MIRRRFLRPPADVGEGVADLIRVVGVLSVLAAFLWWSPTDAGVLALTLPALVAPRFLEARAGFDILYGLTVLVAAWSNVLELYTRVPGWDLVVHFVCTGVVAAMIFVALFEADVVPAPGSGRDRRRVAAVVIPTVGLAISAVWEMIEWIGFTFVSSEIFVAYDDTIGDMALGGLGSVLAGLIAVRVRLVRREEQPPSAADPPGRSGQPRVVPSSGEARSPYTDTTTDSRRTT